LDAATLSILGLRSESFAEQGNTSFWFMRGLGVSVVTENELWKFCEVICDATLTSNLGGNAVWQYWIF
jgi:hypothetical protein